MFFPETTGHMTKDRVYALAYAAGGSKATHHMCRSVMNNLYAKPNISTDLSVVSKHYKQQRKVKNHSNTHLYV